MQLNCWNQSDVVLEFLEEEGMGRTEDGSIPLTWPPTLFTCQTQSPLIILADFHVLFKTFMDRSLDRLRSVAGESVDVTIWTSSLTTEKYIDDLSKDDYTIQGPSFSSLFLEIDTIGYFIYLNQKTLVFSKE